LQAGLFSFSTPSRYSPKQQYFGPKGGFVKRFLVFEKIIVFYPLELLTAGAIASIIRTLLDLGLRRKSHSRGSVPEYVNAALLYGSLAGETDS
jgi:hypothetical protein